MYGVSGKVKPKLKVDIVLTLTDGSRHRGAFFANAQERLLDMLNDERRFLPFVDENGTVSLIAKDAILRVEPVEQAVARTVEPPRWLGQ